VAEITLAVQLWPKPLGLNVKSHPAMAVSIVRRLGRRQGIGPQMKPVHRAGIPISRRCAVATAEETKMSNFEPQNLLTEEEAAKRLAVSKKTGARVRGGVSSHFFDGLATG
jgi:hypothetical protein